MPDMTEHNRRKEDRGKLIPLGELFAYLKERAGLGGALFGIFVFRILPFALGLAAVPAGYLGNWVDSAICVVLALAFIAISAMFEARVEDNIKAASAEAERAIAPTAEILPQSFTATVEKPQKRAEPEKCLECDNPRPQMRDSEKRHWWCGDCWSKRNRKAESDGKVPQCRTQGCIETVAKLVHPWCLECWNWRKEHNCDPIRANNGLPVRSEPERRIANFLYAHRIPYEYERLLPGGGTMRCDFFLPDGQKGVVYIEYFGWANIPGNKGDDYRKTMSRKREIYDENGCDLIELLPQHEPDLEERLAAELRKRGFSIAGSDDG